MRPSAAISKCTYVRTYVRKMVDAMVLVRWFGNNSRTFDGRSANVSTENIVSVNGKKRTAATNVSKLQVGDVLELTFPDDKTIWKAVVIENGGDTTGTREPRRLVRTPNPWRRESPGESPADGRRTSGRTTVPPVRYRDHERSHSPPSEKTVTKRSRSDPAPKAKKQRGKFVWVCTYVGIYKVISCSMGCLIAN